MSLVSGHTSSPSNIILEDRQVLHYTYTICSSLFEHVVQVFYSVDKDELLTQHFERTHHLNLHVCTTNACTHGKSHLQQIFLLLPPTRPSGSAQKPIWNSTSNSISQYPICSRNRRYLSFEISPTNLSSNSPNFLIIFWGLDISPPPPF